MARIRVLLVEHDPTVREEMVESLVAHPLIEVVGSAAEANPDLVRKIRPDVALVDATMPGVGAAAARELLEVSPQTRTIALATFYDLPTILELLKSGAVGCVAKEPDLSLPEIVKFAMEGQAILPRRMMAEVIREFVSILGRADDVARSLEQFERMKCDLVELLAHELRTPVTILQGTADLLVKRGEALTAEQRRDLNDVIQRASARIDRLAKNVSVAANLGPDAGELPTRPEEVGALVTRARDEFPLSGARLRVLARVSALKARVWAAEASLGPRPLVLVIENSLDLSPHNQPVEIEVRLADGEAQVRVSDRGPGISEEVRERIFGAFVRDPSARHRPGIGLGLYLARRIMEAQRGSVAIETRGGGGSTVILTFKRCLEGG